MKTVQPLVQNRWGGMDPPLEPRRTATVPAPARLTNFYPLYGAANDQVDRVLRVQPVQFQRVIPRYWLSTSETRDQGLGPMFAGIRETPALPPTRPAVAGGATDSWAEGRRDAAATAGTARSLLAVREPWLGARVDTFA